MGQKYNGSSLLLPPSEALRGLVVVDVVEAEAEVGEVELCACAPAMLSCIGRHRDCTKVQLERTLAALRSRTSSLFALNLWLKSGAKMRFRISWTRPSHFASLNILLAMMKNGPNEGFLSNFRSFDVKYKRSIVNIFSINFLKRL